MSRLHVNEAAERAVLGSIALGGANVLEPLVAEHGLRPEHLWRDDRRRLLQAAVALLDDGDGLDRVSIIDRAVGEGLDRTTAERGLDDALVEAAGIDRPATHAKTLIRAATWRARELQHARAGEALEQEDDPAWQSAATLADEHQAGADETYDGTLLLADLERELVEDPKVIPTPWPAVNEHLGGGVTPGATTLLSGHSSHGKSLAALGWLDHAASRSTLRVAMYVNEMSIRETRNRLLLGHLGGHLGITLPRLMFPRSLNDVQLAAVRDLLPNLPVHLVPMQGKPWTEIARHIRLKKWDLCCVDLLDRISKPAGQSTIDFEDDAVGGLCNAASVADTHLILVAQLSKGSSTGTPVRPAPTAADIRGSSRKYTDPNNVMFVHQDQDEDDDTGIVTRRGTGTIWIDKARNGSQGGYTPVEIDADKMRFAVRDGRARDVAA